MRPVLLLFASIFSFFTAFGQKTPADLFAELKNAADDTNKVMLLDDIGSLYQYTQPDSALHYMNEGLELAKELDYKKGIATLIGDVGYVYDIHGDFEKATQYLREAKSIFEEIDDLDAVANCNNGLGVIEGKKGNYKDATEYFLKALKHYQSTKNTLGTIQSYIKLGVVNDINGNLDKALEYYLAAQKLNEQTSNTNATLTLLNNIGIVYAKKGDFEKALEYLEEAIGLSEEPKDMALHVSMLTNAGNAYENLDNLDKAIAYHRRALAKARQYQMPEEESRALVNIANVQSKRGQHGLALKSLDSALVIASKIEHTQLMSEIYFGIAAENIEQKDYKTAVENLDQYHMLKDSLFTLDKARDMANLQANYELEESKVHIKDLELKNQKRTFERNIGIISAICILIVLGVGIFYWKRTKKLNQELKESNLVKDKLFSIIGHDLRGPIGGIAQMLELLDEGGFSEEEKKEIIAELRKQGQISFEILNSMLSWGKTQLQGARVNMVDFHPKTIINKNIEVLRAQAQDKAIAIVDRTDGYTKAYADPDHFDFVIRNLLSNAIKFTPSKGKIEIDAIVEDNKKVTFSVKDNGIGISKEKQKQFATSNLNLTLGTNGEKGNGIGLLLSKEFIQANKGNMWIESIEGQGTVFYFSLPLPAAN